MKNIFGRTVPVIVAVIVLAIYSQSSADAIAGATAANASPHSIATVAFKVAPEYPTPGTTPTPATDTTGIQTFTAGANNTIFNFYFVNTGTINADAFSWTITHTAGTAGVTLQQCPIDTTFSSPTLCSNASAPTALALTGTGPALSIGQWLPVELKITKKNAVYTGASTISRSQIRLGINTTA